MILGGSSGGKGMGAPGQSPVKAIGERDFEAEVFKSPLPVLIFFTSERSAVAKKVGLEVDAFAAELSGKLKVVKVELEKAPSLARQLRIQQVPMFMLFAGGRIVDGQAGPLSKKQLRALVEPHLPRPDGALKALELAELLRTGEASVVDTRDAHAFGRAHIPGATNLPAEELENRLAELFMLTGQPVLYCRSGDKTKELALRLAEQGAPVAFLDGGFLAWESEGLPIQR